MNFLKRRKGIIIGAVLAVALLAGSWILGGNYARPVGAVSTEPEVSDYALQASPAQNTPEEQRETTSPSLSGPSTSPATPGTEPPNLTKNADVPDNAGSDISDAYINPEKSQTNDPDGPSVNPTPESSPPPVDPQDTKISETSYSCTLSVRCDTILDHMDLLSDEKHELVPDDGVIFAAAIVTFYEGESVFNVLQREMKRAKIHLEFKNTPIYNSAYIQGINNLYEFDVGELSGWAYKVNDWFPNYGSSRYQLKDGDVVEWVYTCARGDVGNVNFQTES